MLIKIFLSISQFIQNSFVFWIIILLKLERLKQLLKKKEKKIGIIQNKRNFLNELVKTPVIKYLYNYLVAINKFDGDI